MAQSLVAALFMATVCNRLVDGLVRPVFVRYNLDKFWLMYIAWIVGGILAYLTGVNLFAGLLPDDTTGKILTAIVCGGGANLINDLFKTGAQVFIATREDDK